MDDMFLLIDEKKYAEDLKLLHINYTIKEKLVINNIKFADNNAICINSLNRSISFSIVDIDYFDVWKLDTKYLYNNMIRQGVYIDDQRLYLNQNSESIENSQIIYGYFFCSKDFVYNSDFNQNRLIEALNINHQLKFCDLYLMIPGYLSDNVSKNSLCGALDFLGSTINQRLQEEIDEKFITEICRYYLGTIDLIVDKDIIEGKRYVQKAILYLVYHKETGFCILQFVVLNCYIGGNKLNNYFCGNGLIYRYNNHIYNITELLALFNIIPFGKRRSIIFTYGELKKNELVNALASEEYPIGNLKGDFIDLAEKDIALYDIANVYVSSTTMIENCNRLFETIYQRVCYHSVELFFVELLLLQDASVDKIYKELRELQKDQSKSRNYELTIDKLDCINKELTDVLTFSDYDHFLFPSTRISSKKIADAFGLPSIFDKYQQNIDLLKGLVEANKRKNEKKQNNIKNKFLLLLTFLSSLGTFGEIIYVSEKKIKPIIAYFLASIIILMIYVIYKVVIFIGEKNDKKTDRRNKRKIKRQ